ncbi:PREDICTED: sugar transporter ERD6-like 7 [Habropoda laboriosa]|uniref:sugar transporter ERD6-like 7 n=1 Tax=Habropoda laboriosa TaxID=597456 RepID=UPI00083D9999|nr:PREDICTED: sugar transporter ERD6-like 7 [Habropoda laboriosa]
MEMNNSEPYESNWKLCAKQQLSALSSLLSVFMVVILAIPACCLSGCLMEELGRRTFLIISSVISLVGWLTIGLTNHIWCLLIGNAICGLANGLTVSVVPVYIGEISDPVFRTSLLGMTNVAMLLGNWVIIEMDDLLRSKTIIFICTCFSTINCIICLFTRESPVWLIDKGKTDEARDCWVHLRGKKALNEYYSMYMLLISGLGTTSTLCLLGLSVFFGIYKPWISAICFILYFIFEPIGLVPLSWILCGELSRKLRSFGVGFATAFFFFFSYAEMIVTPEIIFLLTLPGTFVMYGVATLTVTAFLISAVPNTKNMTLLELETTFDGMSES